MKIMKLSDGKMKLIVIMSMLIVEIIACIVVYHIDPTVPLITLPMVSLLFTLTFVIMPIVLVVLIYKLSLHLLGVE